MDAEAMVFVVADDAPLRTSLQDLMESVELRVAAFASAQGRCQLVADRQDQRA